VPGWQDAPVRIGTWNLDGRWSADHRRLLEGECCDVWLLTEVPTALSLGDGALVRSEQMRTPPARAWAAVWSDQPLEQLPPAHPASALARRAEIVLCSSVLPWRGARPYWPDEGAGIAAITAAALARLRPALMASAGPVIWGGDWNHAMQGREYTGSKAGRAAICELVAERGLTVATVTEPHAIDGLLSIDHIAVPQRWRVDSSRRVVAEAHGKRLSDHDAYVVKTTDP
jgi:hypothetical protein